MIEIRQWLRDPERSFEEGVKLYRQYGDNNGLKVLFSSSPTAFSRNKLKEALQALTSEQLAYKDADPAISKASVRRIDPDSPVAHLEQRKAELFKRVATLHDRLLFLPDNEIRLEASLEILDGCEELRIVWAKMDRYRETGQLDPEPQPEEPASPESIQEITRILRNYPAYISKANKKLKNLPDGTKKENIISNIREWSKALDAAKQKAQAV